MLVVLVLVVDEVVDEVVDDVVLEVEEDVVVDDDVVVSEPHVTDVCSTTWLWISRSHLRSTTIWAVAPNSC